MKKCKNIANKKCLRYYATTDQKKIGPETIKKVVARAMRRETEKKIKVYF